MLVSQNVYDITEISLFPQLYKMLIVESMGDRCIIFMNIVITTEYEDAYYMNAKS